MHFRFYIAILTGKAFCRSFLFSAIVLHGLPGWAQESIFPQEDGRIVYSNKIMSDSLNQIALWGNALDYLESLELIDQVKGQAVIIDNESKEATARQGFYLLKKGIVTKQIEGMIEASTSIQIIPGGYKYTIDSILFQPYARNRYGKYAPKSSKKYSLESIYKKKSGKDWIRHFNDINGKYVENMSNIESKMNE